MVDLATTATDRPRMLSVAETARLLGVSRATVRAHADELGGFRIGRQWRFPADLTAPTLPNSQRGPHPDRRRIRNAI